MTTATIDSGDAALLSGASLAPPGLDRLVDTDTQLSEQFTALSELTADWDGEDARPIEPTALRFAWEYARELIRAGLPVPEVFPVPDGGVQLEWSEGPVEIEVDVEPYASSAVFVCDDESSGQRFDGELPADESLLRLALARLRAYSAGASA